MNARVFFLVLACLPVALARGEEALRWQVRVEFLFARLPQRAALALLPALRSPSAIDGAVAKLWQQLETGEATLLASPVLWAADQQRVMAETSEECRYATEHGFDWRNGGFHTPSREEWANYSPQWAMGDLLRRTIEVPTAFETRNLGISIELEPVVFAGGRAIALNLQPRQVTLEGLSTRPPVSAQAMRWRYEVPQFRTHQTTTRLDAASGKWMLCSVFVRPGTEPQMEFGLLRATAFPLRP